MISFKEFLLESQGYPLYHGTGYSAALHILRSNKMTVGVYNDAISRHPLHGKPTISFTRSKNFASYWSKRVSDWNYRSEPGSSIIFEIDRGKLRSTHKILPYNHFDYRGARSIDTQRWGNDGDSASPRKGTEHRHIDTNQYEERTDRPIKNIDKYIIALYMDKSTFEYFKDEAVYKKYKDRVKII